MAGWMKVLSWKDDVEGEYMVERHVGGPTMLARERGENETQLFSAYIF
jgi:hypothetical protein